MSDDLVDDSQFLIQFPVWMLFHPEKRSELLEFSGPNGEKGFPIFTDHDLADRCRRATPLGHYVLGMAKDLSAFAEVLPLLERKGFTHVAIDYSPRTTRFFPLDQLRLIVEQERANYPNDPTT